jgi:hypothetical protein
LVQGCWNHNLWGFESLIYKYQASWIEKNPEYCLLLKNNKSIIVKSICKYIYKSHFHVSSNLGYVCDVGVLLNRNVICKNHVLNPFTMHKLCSNQGHSASQHWVLHYIFLWQVAQLTLSDWEWCTFRQLLSTSEWPKVIWVYGVWSLTFLLAKSNLTKKTTCLEATYLSVAEEVCAPWSTDMTWTVADD